MLSAVSPPPLIVDLIAIAKRSRILSLSLSSPRVSSNIFSEFGGLLREEVKYTRKIETIRLLSGIVSGLHAKNEAKFDMSRRSRVVHEQVLINGRSWPRVLQKPQCISPTPTAGPWLITPEVCNFMRMYATMVAYKPFGDYTRRCA